MQVNRRTTTAGRNGGVAAGSVWENRIKIDQVKGGVKVFNGRENPQEQEVDDKGNDLKSNQTHAVGRNRRTWKSEIEGDPVQLRKSRSELLKKLAHDFNKERVFKGRWRRRRPSSHGKGDGDEDEDIADDEEEEMEMEKEETESIDIKEMNIIAEEKQSIFEEREKVKKIHQIHEIPTTSVSPRVEEEKIHEQTIPPFRLTNPASKEKLQQIEAKLRKIQEASTSPSKHWAVADGEKEKLQQIHEIPISPLKQRSFQKEKIHDIPISHLKQRSLEKEKIHDIPMYVQKQRSLAEKQKLYQFHELLTSSDEEKKSPSSTDDHPSVDQYLRKSPPTPIVVEVAVEETFERIQDNQNRLQSNVEETSESESVQVTRNRLQSIVDLVMWRDMSKSAIIFGLGTFILGSSSFIKDLNFSLVSSSSYLGLFYLAAIFFYKTILCRGAIYIEGRNQKYMVGEEEAIWVLKLVLPYFNELLINVRDLFSGDPATTMKLATLLFVLARCGSSITIWTMTRLAFFGVFTLPKLFCAYSNQITGYGKFWFRRFGDAWDSCTHKKVLAATMFTLIWNSSSAAARIWAVFMLIAAVRCYQQSSSSASMINEEWCEEEVHEDSKGGQCMRQKKNVPIQAELVKEKEKKGSQ